MKRCQDCCEVASKCSKCEVTVAGQIKRTANLKQDDSQLPAALRNVFSSKAFGL